MKLIEADDLREFEALLARQHLAAHDFELSEIDTTDPKTDEIFALAGTLTITRKSSWRQKQYPIGDGSLWLAEFQRDLMHGDLN